MAVRGWGGRLATAVGIAAAVGAAQLGFGYGLGIITWTPPDTAADSSPDAVWAASLAWATWIAATSTVAGTVGAQRLTGRTNVGAHARSRPSGIASAFAAALGALVTVLLVAVPAGEAVPTGGADPQSVAGAYAAAGVMVGILVAIWALRSPSAAVNVVASVGWLWSLAVLAVVDGVLAGRGTDTARLGVWQLSADRPAFWFGDFYWPAAVLSLASALVVGALAARRAARSTYLRVGAAVSGTAGPLLVAAAYLLTVPRLPATGAEQLSAQLVAAYAVVAGLAGSALVAALAQRREARTAADGRDATAAMGGPDATSPAGDGTAANTDGDRANSRETPPAAPTEPDLHAIDAPSSGTDGRPATPDPAAAGADPGAPAQPASTAGLTQAPVPGVAPVESGADVPRRRAARSTPKLPRSRRGASPVDPESTPGPTGSVTAAVPEGSSAAPDAVEPPGAPGTTPADGPVAEPRPRGRAATRRPRD